MDEKKIKKEIYKDEIKINNNFNDNRNNNYNRNYNDRNYKKIGVIRDKLIEQLIYFYDQNNSKLYDKIKIKILQFLKIKDEYTFDLLFYLYIRSINEKRDKIKKLLIEAIDKIEVEYIKNYVSDIKKDVPLIFEIDQNDTLIFLKKIFTYEPLWVYNFLDNKKGLLEKKLYDFYLKIDNKFKKLEQLKKEIDDIIENILKFDEVSYININYFIDIVDII